MTTQSTTTKEALEPCPDCAIIEKEAWRRFSDSHQGSAILCCEKHRVSAPIVAPVVDHDLFADAGAIIIVNEGNAGARVEIRFSELEDAQRLHKALAECRAPASPAALPSIRSNREPHPFQEHPLYPNYCAFAVGDEDYRKRETDNVIHHVPAPAALRDEAEQTPKLLDAAHHCDNGTFRPYPSALCSACRTEKPKLSIRDLCSELNATAPPSTLAKAVEEIAQLEKPNHTNDLIAISHCDICSSYKAKIAAIIERCFSGGGESGSR